MSQDTSAPNLKFRKRKKRKRTLKPRETTKEISNTKDTKATPTDVIQSKQGEELKECNDSQPPLSNPPLLPSTNATEPDDDATDFLETLKEAKSIHRLQFQSKHKGLLFEENHEFTTSGLENPDTFRHDPSKDFGDSFSAEKAADDKLKQQREKWVEQKMREKLLKKGRVLPQNADDAQNSESPQGDEVHNQGTSFQEQLYALSDKLAVPLSSMRHNEEAGERWLAGMTEYELPLEFKLKNIKQTEDAKRKLLQPKSKHDKVFDIPRNYNGDFTTHHFDRVKMAEQKRKLMESQQSMRMQRERKRRRTSQ